ncbi:TPA: hypothetical protein QDB28_004024 [Burkholderia vietnamiensis]|nr:hypothetical protein [Burkholderia vietnamiensis]
MQSADDQALLSAVPAFISISDMLKATPITEGADRFVYLEASNESTDQQGEVVLAKALADSAAYYLKFGNLDIDHYTQIGAKQGIPNYELYEIGRPIEVRADKGVTFVKAQIYTGSGAAAERANNFWSSLVDLNPPKRWFPSVGGAIQEKEVGIDPATKSKRVLIKRVRWTNIGLSLTPVNPNLATVSTVPFGALTKSWGSDGFDLAKALEAGYGTDSASLTGGAALRVQSLDRQLHSYWDMRDQLSDSILKGKVKPRPDEIHREAQKRFGLSADEAGDFAERFLGDLKHNLKEKE